MPWATVYLIVLVLAFGGGIASQLGWRPPVVTLWDARAVLYFYLTSFLLALFSSLALAGTAPVARWPKRLRAMPAMIALCTVGLGFQGLLNLSVVASLEENLRAVGTSLAYGLGLGLAVGLIASFEPAGTATTRTSPRRRNLVVVAMLLATAAIGCGLLVLPRDRDDGKASYTTRFNSPTSTLLIEVFAAPLDKDQRYGVVKITWGNATNALVLEPNEWDSFMALLAKAESPGSPSWTDVGVISDTGPGEITSLTLSKGRGVRFIARSPHGSTVEFDLSPSDVARFNAAVAQVQQQLHH